MDEQLTDYPEPNLNNQITPLNDFIAQRLREICYKNVMTPDELMIAGGFDEREIAELQFGFKEMSISQLVRICTVLKISPNKICGDVPREILSQLR